MKVSSILAVLAVLLLVAGVSSASLSIVQETRNLGTLGSDPNPYYGVTIHFVSSDAIYKFAGCDLALTGQMFQVQGHRGGSADTVTFWLNQVETELTNAVTGGPLSGRHAASLTAVEASFDSHLLIRKADVPVSTNNPGEFYLDPAAWLDIPPDYPYAYPPTGYWGEDGVTATNPRADWGNFMGNDPQSENFGRMSFAISTAARLQDTPFIYLVLQGTKTVNMSGMITMSTDAGVMEAQTFTSANPYVIAVPEPVTMAMLALGAVGLVLRRRRA